MSKEQTRIEHIRDFAIQKMKENNTLWSGLQNLSITDWIIICKDYAEQEKQKAVLEALEREVPKACMKYNSTDIFNKKLARQYYETEVKPKYNE